MDKKAIPLATALGDFPEPATEAVPTAVIHGTPEACAVVAKVQELLDQTSPHSWLFLSPPLAPDELGRLGDYRVLELLGEGGMGFVFRAEDIHLRRFVALKVMRPEVAAKPDAAERFLREGRAAASLKSDHIITIYQVGMASGVPFLAMEYLEGQPLNNWLQTQPQPVALTAVLRIVRDTLRGLAAAHEKGLIHRDIKPANLWLERQGRVKILDFGLTRSQDASDQVTAEGIVVGTPAYMAPEQASGRTIDARADLFSVGTVMYFALSGRNPFVRETVMGTLGAVTYETHPSVNTMRADVPTVYAAFLDRLLAKDPARRPTSASAALAELATIEKNLRGPSSVTVPLPAPLVAPLVLPTDEPPWSDLTEAIAPPPPKKRGEQARLKWPLRLSGFGVVVVCIGIGIAVASKTNRQPEPPRTEGPESKTSKPVAQAPPKPDVPAVSPDRRAAEYTIAMGGWVTINGEVGSGAAIRHVARLPKSDFRLTTVDLCVAAVTNEGLAAFQGTKHITTLRLRELPQLRGTGFQHVAGNTEMEALDLWGSYADDALLATCRTWKKLQGINLGGCKNITDRGLLELQGQREWHWVNLAECHLLTDAALAVFADAPELVELTLNGCTQITNRGLANFRECPKLVEYNVGGTKVTDEHLATLPNFPLLRAVMLDETGITTVGLRHLAKCPKLAVLNIAGTTANDATLTELATWASLSHLTLYGTKISDDGLKELARFPKLEFAGLQNTPITDAGLLHLHEAKNIKVLELNSTPVTERGIGMLQAKLPAARIQWDETRPRPKE